MKTQCDECGRVKGHDRRCSYYPRPTEQVKQDPWMDALVPVIRRPDARD